MFLEMAKLRNSHLAVHVETLPVLSSLLTASWPTETLCIQYIINSSSSSLAAAAAAECDVPCHVKRTYHLYRITCSGSAVTMLSGDHLKSSAQLIHLSTY